MLIFTEINYSLRYNTLITENWDDVADHNNDFEITITQQYTF